jgi:diketogulonate reductase-like aldo/keto reductase
VNKIKSHIIYGTAWKEEKTEKLTLKALDAGFDAVDTANQRKHYFEEGVGRAIASFIRSTGIKREDLFIQTKFTHKESQDHRLPFDPRADPGIQVRQSLKSSLVHLQTDYIDSYVLHGPSARFGLSEIDWEVWKTMEELCSEGIVQRLGISNINVEQLKLLLEKVIIKPSYVQNRCYARLGWDKEIREICKKNNIVYQGFSLLTANREVLSNPKVVEISKIMNKTVEQIIFSFTRYIGILPLTGTKNREHMEQDLESVSIALTEEQLAMLENIAIKS